MKQTINRIRRFHVWVALFLCGVGPFFWGNPIHGQTGEQNPLRQGIDTAGPIADIPVSTYDLGSIKSKGVTYHRDFAVLNVGNEVLEVKEVMVG